MTYNFWTGSNTIVLVPRSPSGPFWTGSSALENHFDYDLPRGIVESLF